MLIDLVIDEKHNHCVAFEGVKGDTVMLRDPQNGKRFNITRQEFLDSAAAVHIAPGSEGDFDWSRPRMGNLFTSGDGGLPDSRGNIVAESVSPFAAAPPSYVLSATSPCLDKVTGPTTRDGGVIALAVEGRARVTGGAMDIGAYER